MTAAQARSQTSANHGVSSNLSNPRHREWLDGTAETAYPVDSDEIPELNSEMTGLDVYMARLQNLPPLSDEEQSELALRYSEQGDEQAGQLLVMTNLRLVFSLAMDYARGESERFELIQEGNVGISKALERFDPDKNVRFTSYAQYWIRAKILDYLINRGRTIRLGASRDGRTIFYNLHKARRHLRDRGLEPTVERVAEYLGVDEKEVVRVGNQMDAPPSSLDEEMDDEGGRTLGDLIPSEAAGPDEIVADGEFLDRVREELRAFGETLSDARRRAIWHERTISDDPKLLRVLGDEWGVCKERIRQIESTLCDEFRSYFAREMGGEQNVRDALRN